ncbi:MAG: polyribonucleotide nucleotidyltransferase [Candidatus Paceibacterota bacterium]|jgi:polyribonucleotide nucleotidyltransferase
MQKKEYSLEVGGRTLTAMFTDLADQATGSVIIKYGETVVLATAVLSPKTKEDSDYFPLTVEYEERYYAAGKIGGGRFQKREGKPSEEAVLSGRIIDRTIRPLFDSAIRNEIQVIITVLSLDEDNDPDVPAIIGASLALATSPIPWNGPVSAVRLGETAAIEGLIVNPSYKERGDGVFDLLVCGDGEKINMIEAEGGEIPEQKVKDAFRQAVGEIAKIQAWQKNIITELKPVKVDLNLPTVPAEADPLFAENIEPNIEAILFEGAGKKSADSLKEDWLKLREEKMPETNLGAWLNFFEDKIDAIVHQEAIEKKRRTDGRALDEVRSLSAQVGGFSSVVHGAGLFYRGATHVLTTLTLSGPKSAQLIEGMEGERTQYFMHHYNFPPFSVGETGRVGNPSRRSIGHGALAEKSLRGVIPSREIFPYTIRLVSEVFASNGSSSQASVCASTLALMDGGVPIKNPVAGISVGLMYRDDQNYELITDIQGVEDHYGDMDFKVAGTKEGITGIQLDIKMGGIPVAILDQAIDRARVAREQILAKMAEVISAPRAEINPAAPKIIKITIPVEKIGSVIGPGGKMIQKISAETDSEIEIEDDGSVYITGQIEGANKAKQIIEDMCHEYKAGERFEGEVVRLMDFGAFVQIAKDTDGLVHVSEVAPFRIDKISDAVKIGDRVPVVIKEIDEKNRINLSIKQADPDWAKNKGLTPSTNNGSSFTPRNNPPRNGFSPRN